jgi:8-oxo-dGTP diphosphatase
MSDLVEVVAGIAVRKSALALGDPFTQRILLTQRLPTKDFPLTWECPGGKVDGNESHHQALRREWEEELGIKVGKIREQCVWSGEFENAVSRPDRARIRLLFYFVIEFSGEPMPLEGQGVGWFTCREMLELSLAPGNARALNTIIAVVSTWAP